MVHQNILRPLIKKILVSMLMSNQDFYRQGKVLGLKSDAFLENKSCKITGRF